MQEIDRTASAALPASRVEHPATCARQRQAMIPMQWLLGAGALATAGALYTGWDWLVAAGLASVILVVAPCLVMCALGLCMKGGPKP